MNDRDNDKAYAEQQVQEDLGWIEEAIPHVVTLTAALLRNDMSTPFAVRDAIKAYTLIEQGLINETANQ